MKRRTHKARGVRGRRLWLWCALALVVAAGVCTALALSGRDAIRLENGVLTGVEDGWIVGKLPQGYRKLAQIEAPEGYHAAVRASANTDGGKPEWYFEPDDESSPVEFLYFTSGAAAARSLADTAVKAYDAFYDDYLATGIVEETLAGKDACWFGYTCSYPNQDATARVYAQSAVGYFPSAWPDACVVAIVSFAFDDAGDYLDAAALRALLELAAEGLTLEQAR